MNTAEQALTDLDLSEVYLQLNAVDEARAAARSAVSACVACGRAREASSARRLLAITEALSGDLVESLRIFDEVVAEFDAAGLDAQSAVTRLERASVALRAGDAAGALESSRAAADALGRASLGARRRQARVVEARALLALGDHTAAIRVARATIRSARNRHGDHATYQCHHVIALAEVARGRQTAALNAYRKAIESVEALRSRIGVDDFKSRFLEDKVDLFEGAVALCLEMGTPDLVTEALRTLELAKSRSLSDLLADYLREAAPGTEQSRAARERFKALVDELAWYTSRRERDEPGSDGARREARRRSHELETCEARVADAFRQLQVEDPRFADLHAPGVVDPEQLQALIDPGDALVEYAQTGETYSAIVVTSDGIRACRDLASIAEVNRLLDGVRFQMEKFAFGRDFASRELGHLRQGADLYLARLHDALLGPIGSLVGNRNLIVVPHGRLHYVPMHALRSANGYVIEERAVSYAPSATVYALCAAAPSRPAGPALICGVEDASIPEIAREIEALRGLFPNATVLAGPDATRQAVVRHAEHSRVLHIASHARFRSDNPMLSSLRLADGDLTFYDVFSLKLAADLVVLSGCNTGAVAVGAGDELHGLMRGFLYAGAPSLLISMWAADDSATASLMRDFYSGIRDGLPKRDALRSAQLAALGREQHPYYWAPFTDRQPSHCAPFKSCIRRGDACATRRARRRPRSRGRDRRHAQTRALDRERRQPLRRRTRRGDSRDEHVPTEVAASEQHAQKAAQGLVGQEGEPERRRSPASDGRVPERRSRSHRSDQRTESASRVHVAGGSRPVAGARHRSREHACRQRRRNHGRGARYGYRPGPRIRRGQPVVESRRSAEWHRRRQQRVRRRFVRMRSARQRRRSERVGGVRRHPTAIRTSRRCPAPSSATGRLLQD